MVKQLKALSSDFKIVFFIFQDGSEYWPHGSEVRLEAGKIQVQLEKETPIEHYTVRELNVSNKSGVSKVRPENYTQGTYSMKFDYWILFGSWKGIYYNLCKNGASWFRLKVF